MRNFCIKIYGYTYKRGHSDVEIFCFPCSLGVGWVVGATFKGRAAPVAQ